MKEFTTKHKKSRYDQKIQAWIVTLTIGAIQGIIKILEVTGLSQKIEVYFRDVWIEKNPIPFIIIGCSVSTLIGYFLNRFKKKNQIVYGITEILLSLLITANVVYGYIRPAEASATFQLFKIFIPFLTTVYFTQRGFNNFYDGLEKKKKEPTQVE